MPILDRPVGYMVVSMKASDPDRNAILRYSLTEPIEAYDLYNHAVNINDYNYTELFRIDSSNGQVFVNDKLDITAVKRIVYTVQAIDIAAEGPLQIGRGENFLCQYKSRLLKNIYSFKIQAIE